MEAVATAIVNGRFVIFALFLVACIYCGLSVGRVQLETTLTAFLPESTETRQGIDVMADEFTSYATASVMVSNVTYAVAANLAEEIGAVDHVVGVSLDDSPQHYAHASALLSVSFDNVSGNAQVKEAMNTIRQMVEPYDSYISTSIGSNYTAQLAQEMVGVVAIAAVVIMLILLLTSRSYFEVAISMAVFIVAALLNMGTNFWLGKISSISNSVAIILQLALAIDYAIILSHRYQDTAGQFNSDKDAIIDALRHAIPEIASSSLTTISGLLALTLMQFGLGPDLGLVLAKGILCSLISVFFLMPGLILCAARLLKKTAHKPLLPSIEGWGHLLGRAKNCFVWLFALLVPVAIFCSGQTTWAFNDSSVSSLIYSESRYASHKITDTFDESTSVAIMVPAGDYASEKALLAQVEALPQIKSATGLANITVSEGDDAVLTDSFTPRQLAELLDIDVEQATLLFQAYGLEHDQYQGIFGNSSTYSVPLIDLFEYLFEKMDQGVITLEGSKQETLDELRETLRRATDQLRGTEHSRMVATATVPAESAESVQLVEDIRALAQEYYGEGNVLITGNITSARDLSDSFSSDSKLISILTALFVFVILLLTFRSVAAALIMVFVIQGAIWMNFSFPYLTNFTSSFVTYMICSAIQMGATIDYAIVMMNRYQTARKTLDPKPAMARAVAGAFPTVLTSGLIMAVAGLLIAYRVSDVYVGHIGLGVGRGAIISVILVLTVLPQLMVLLDGWIERTRFTLPRLGRGRAADGAGGTGEGASAGKTAAGVVTALLAAVLLVGAPAGVQAAWADAQTVTVATAADLEKLAQDCSVDSYSENISVQLTADIDLSDSSFAGIPFFAGAFYGNGHTVSGFTAADGSHQGFFRYVAEGAWVGDLHVAGTVAPDGSAECVGGLAGSNAGTLVNCSFEGVVTGASQVGGIVGENTGTIEGCVAKGQVAAQHQGGGIAGSNDGTLEGCTNRAQVNTTPVADTAAKSNTSKTLSVLELLGSSLTGVSEEDVLNVTDAGGIAGLNTGVISGCSNEEAVGYARMGYNVGGVAGRSNGIVTGSANSALVKGRKDVGGIVGQLEPYTKWDISSSKLADLQNKMSSLNSAVNATISHLSGSAQGAAPYLTSLRGYLETAASELAAIGRQMSGSDDALETLKGADYTAFLDALSSAVGVKSQLTSYVGEAGLTLASDVSSINSAFSALTGSLESTATSVVNVSIDTENDISATSSASTWGSVRSSQNRGTVEADSNVGGVVGSVAYEVSFDPEGSLSVSSILFTNAQYLVSATVLDCSSVADVTAKKSGAGGVVGVMSFGAVTDCQASGAVAVQSGSYAGGVVGQVQGTVARSNARAAVSAQAYAGGIAGQVEQGATVSDCLAYPQVEEGREYRGAIAGASQGTVEGCLFVACGLGGIDGISYDGQAMPLSYDDMIARDDAPDLFRQVAVTFVDEEGQEISSVALAYGGSVTAFPAVESRDGKYWRWECSLADLQDVRFSRTVGGSWGYPVTALATEGAQPQWLVEGVFDDNQRLEAVPASDQDQALVAATLTVEGYQGTLTVHARVADSCRVTVDGVTVETIRDGSYVVFDAPNGATVVVTREASFPVIPLALAFVAVALAAVCVVLLRHRKTA